MRYFDFFLKYKCAGRKMMYAPIQTAGTYKAVLTYHPAASDICLNTAREEFLGPTKNIFMFPSETSQREMFITNAKAHKATKVATAPQ